MHKKDKEPPKYPEIGARLTQFIADSGEPNARQFALKAGLTPQLVSHLAAGNSIPGGETLVALAKAYKGFDANWLLTGRGRALTPADQLPPQVPSELKPPQAPQMPGTPTPDEWRENMRVVAESAELREVKSERDNLRKTNDQLLAIIRQFTGGNSATDAAQMGKAEASLEAATLFETVDALQAEYVAGHRIFVAGFQQQGVHRQLA